MSELGNHLKQKRLEQNLSLDELQEMTKIQKRYLVGIEEGNFDVLPGSFYVRAFIKQYAEAVGVDPEAILEQYQHELPNTYEDMPEQLSRVKTYKEPSKASKALDFLPKILVIAAVLLAAVIIWILVQKGSNDESIQTDDGTNSVKIETSGVEPKKEEENKQVEENVGETEESPSKDKAAQGKETQQTISVKETKKKETVYELANTDRFVIDIETSGNSWIEVKNTKGKSFLAQMMHQNEKQTVNVSAEEEIRIVIGDARFAAIYVNGQAVPYEIDPNEQVRQDMVFVFQKGKNNG